MNDTSPKRDPRVAWCDSLSVVGGVCSISGVIFSSRGDWVSATTFWMTCAMCNLAGKMLLKSLIGDLEAKRAAD